MKSISIYFDKNLRCRVTPTGIGNQFRLTIQKRFLFFWFDTDFWKDVKEGYWGENSNTPGTKSPFIIRSISGHVSEAYKTGTLDLDFVIRDFIEQYQEAMAKKIQLQQNLASLGQRVAIIEGKIRASKQRPTHPESAGMQAPDNPGYTERLRGVDRHYDVAPPNPNIKEYASDEDAIAGGVPIGGMYQAKSKAGDGPPEWISNQAKRIDRMIEERGQVTLSGKEVSDRLSKSNKATTGSNTKPE